MSRICEQYGLPVDIPKGLNPYDVMAKMTLDKKNAASVVRTVILTSIGNVLPNPIGVSTDTLKRLLLPIISVVPPSKPVSGTITVPGSKSISNRALLLSSLAKGSCKLSGLLHAHDTHVMLDSLSKLGFFFCLLV